MTERLLIPWRPSEAQKTPEPGKRRAVPPGAWLVDPNLSPPTAWTLHQAARSLPAPPTLFFPDDARSGEPWYDGLPVFQGLKPRFLSGVEALPPWTAFDRDAFRPSALSLELTTLRKGEPYRHVWQARLYLPEPGGDWYDDAPQPIAVQSCGLSIEMVRDLLFKAYFVFDEDGDAYDTQQRRFLRYAEAVAARMLYSPDRALETAVRATALPMLSFLMAPGRRFRIIADGMDLTVRAAGTAQTEEEPTCPE